MTGEKLTNEEVTRRSKTFKSVRDAFGNDRDLKVDEEEEKFPWWILVVGFVVLIFLWTVSDGIELPN